MLDNLPLQGGALEHGRDPISYGREAEHYCLLSAGWFSCSFIVHQCSAHLLTLASVLILKASFRSYQRATPSLLGCQNFSSYYHYYGEVEEPSLSILVP